MIIEIKQPLLDLIAKIEANAKQEYPEAEFWWLYNKDGDGAICRVANGWNVILEYDVSINKDGSVSAMQQDVYPSDVEGYSLMPFDSDYEPDPEEEEEEDED